MMFLKSHVDWMKEEPETLPPPKKAGPVDFLYLTDDIVFPPTSQYLPTELFMRKLILATFSQW